MKRSAIAFASQWRRAPASLLGVVGAMRRRAPAALRGRLGPAGAERTGRPARVASDVFRPPARPRPQDGRPRTPSACITRAAAAGGGRCARTTGGGGGGGRAPSAAANAAGRSAATGHAPGTDRGLWRAGRAVARRARCPSLPAASNSLSSAAGSQGPRLALPALPSHLSCAMATLDHAPHAEALLRCPRSARRPRLTQPIPWPGRPRRSVGQFWGSPTTTHRRRRRRAVGRARPTRT